MSELDVPEDFRRIGYSGLFWHDAQLDDTSPVSLDTWEARCPFLLDTPGWMALRVNREAGTITLVRKDWSAVGDIAVGSPLGGREITVRSSERLIIHDS